MKRLMTGYAEEEINNRSKKVKDFFEMIHKIRIPLNQSSLKDENSI